MSEELDQLREEAEMRRQAIATDVDLVTDRVDPTRIADRQKAKFSERVGSLKSTVFGSSDNERSQSSNSSDDGASLKDRASGAIDTVNESTPDSVAEFTEGNPLAAGLIGLGVGLLAATLIPETKEESRIADRVQGHVDSAATQLAQAGQQTAETIQPAAQDAAMAVKDSATESAQSVKGQATDAASNVADNAKSEAKDAAPTN